MKCDRVCQRRFFFGNNVSHGGFWSLHVYILKFILFAALLSELGSMEQFTECYGSIFFN